MAGSELVDAARVRPDGGGVRPRRKRVAAWAGAAWGFAEATVFFIVPDVLLGAVGLFVPRAAPRVLALTLAGALAGGIVTYAVASEVRPARTEAWADAVPTVDKSAIRRVDREMQEDGPRSVLYGPVRMGTPYKLYARAAGVQDESLAGFVLWSIPGRLERMLPVTLLAALAGVLGRRWIERRARIVLALYCLLWVAVYAVYVIRIGI